MCRECAEHLAVTQESIARYGRYLRENEKCERTILKYMRDVRSMMGWLAAKDTAKDRSDASDGISGDASGDISKDVILQWRAHLVAQGLTPRTVNAKLSAVNGLLRCLGREDCRVRFLKVQRRLFRAREKDLTRGEYERLLKTAAERGDARLRLLMETMCATGIRVSEIQYITVEALHSGQADIFSKGKVRTILLPKKLCQKLKKYAKARKIGSGTIFRTRNGRTMSRRQIWAEMKRLCQAAKVEADKVFPHNLRHLFATSFYAVCKDIVRLADVLGHSSIETTRIYLISTGEEHRRLLERLRLVQ